MFTSNWHRFVATVGLVFLASLGQAQEQTQSSQGDAATQQEPAQSFSIPVRIIEDEATTEASKSSEDEARRNQKDDLIAQQGMNTATQAINRATQRMAKYAFWSTILVGFGTVLLIITLWLTRQANKAALRAVEVTDQIGKAQTRAYLAVTSAGVQVWTPKIDINLTFTNTGKSPANDVEIRTMWAGEKGEFCPDWINEIGEGRNIGSVAPGRQAIHVVSTNESTNPEKFLTAEQISEIESGEREFWVFGDILYTDAFDTRQETSFRLVMRGRDGEWVLSYCNEGNHAT